MCVDVVCVCGCVFLNGDFDLREFCVLCVVIEWCGSVCEGVGGVDV